MRTGRRTHCAPQPVALRRSNERRTGSRVTNPIAMLEFPAVDTTQRIQSKVGDRSRQTCELNAQFLAIGAARY
jgi:hypothetical protein